MSAIEKCDIMRKRWDLGKREKVKASGNASGRGRGFKRATGSQGEVETGPFFVQNN